MQIHELKPNNSFKDRKRVGRGGKRGTYSGRGQNGQKCRAGASFQPMIREWIKKYHKLRGYNFNSIQPKATPINLDVLEANFKANEIVSAKTLLEKKLIRRLEGKLPKVKILGNGNLTKAVIVEGCKVSKSAKEIIEKQSGEVK